MPLPTVDIHDIFLDATWWLGTGDTGLTSRICGELALDIVEGRLEPGQELSSVNLAERFGTSRTPIREALFRLESEGLIVNRPRHTPHVFKPTIAQERDIYQLRAHLHALVSELVVDRATDEQLDELGRWRSLCIEDLANNDNNAYFWHNIAARNVETFYAGNMELQRMLSSLGLRTLQLRHLSLSLPGRSKASLDRHVMLLAAYRDRDVETAKRITVEIINAGREAIEAWLINGRTGDQTELGASSTDDARHGRGSLLLN